MNSINYLPTFLSKDAANFPIWKELQIQEKNGLLGVYCAISGFG